MGRRPAGVRIIPRWKNDVAGNLPNELNQCHFLINRRIEKFRRGDEKLSLSGGTGQASRMADLKIPDQRNVVGKRDLGGVEPTGLNLGAVQDKIQLAFR